MAVESRAQKQLRLFNEAILQARQLSRTAPPIPPIITTTMATIVKKSISKWSIQGLDLTDAGFSKLQAKEATYPDETKKYDLKAADFKNYISVIIEKLDRIKAKTIFAVTSHAALAPTSHDIATGYSNIVIGDMTSARNTRWPATDPTFTTQEDADKFTDRQIKAMTVGDYIHNSLTPHAKKELDAESDKFKVTDSSGDAFYDGPSYLYVLANFVDPDNGHLVAATKKLLRQLHVKNFNFSVKTMLAEFSTLEKRISDLDGQYSDDDKFIDLYACLETMQESSFATYVQKIKDEEMEKSRNIRLPVNEIITKMKKKQTRMEIAQAWNVMSKQDQMVMALVGMIEKGSKKTDNNNKTTKNTNNNNSNAKEDATKELDSNEPKLNWYTRPPAEDEPRTKTSKFNDKVFNWCTKCRKGKGKWVNNHTDETHIDNFKAEKKDTEDVKKNESNPAAKKAKRVTFSNTVSQEPTVQVHEKLLKDAKTYLAQFQDFGPGGGN